MVDADRDAKLRLAAFDHVRLLALRHDHLTSAHLSPGLIVDGERVPLVNPQRGIFKPRQLSRLPSIRTVFPRAGAKIWYDDQRRVHDQIYSGHDIVDYAFMGDDPEVAENRWLREAFEDQTPVIYFLGIAPGQYNAILPVFVVGWDAANLKAQIAFSEDERASKPPYTALERRYGLRAAKQRLHQAQFRAAVISAYGGRCALSNLPEARLLDAAHIVPDADEVWGAPFVPNGLPFSKIHHAAFDAHLIGIDPDFRPHDSAQLMEQRDGPVLEALKAADGNSIRLPKRQIDRPDRDGLAMRFERFRMNA